MATPLVRNPNIDLRYTPYKLSIRKSKIHRFGVFALQQIPGKRKVIEYTGERINRIKTSKRGDGKYTYLFTLDKYWTIDGAIGGSGAEIINHSCSPNLISRIMKGHILYMSLRPIKAGEELTIDYNFGETGDASKCKCGAKNCRGILESTDESTKKKAAREKKRAAAAKQKKGA